MWLLGFEPRSPRPQRGILTTKLQPLVHKRIITGLCKLDSSLYFHIRNNKTWTLNGSVQCQCEFLVNPKRITSAYPRDLVTIVGDNIRNKAVVANTNKEENVRAGHPDGNVENHHNIPRPYYNQWGSSPNGGGDEGNDNDNGSG
ncbi:hypothetical protein CDL12_19569 [Handroanthus impetiginosus]|uniref:Uncharacterized protein n=1 Tax=Handroanthus impetiginosus TaxID=429701 RepID=A0A2G9GRH7_9LAMI|nr:hypothetical protein CDL12_19569 [Handroanthus impetiginosus]